ncbi:MAG: hypothetical protein IJG84_14905 [Kiritimatiellae bacterium]|nr:hypothetical protein [Kiritimatiellia bacterium]
MKTLAVAAVAAAWALAAVAAGEAGSGTGVQPQKPGMEMPRRGRLTPEQARERNAKNMMRRYGGRLRKAGSAHGKVVFLNAQKRVARAGLQNALDVVEDRIHPVWEYVEAATANPFNPGPDLKKAGADVGVAIVDSEGVPSLLIAPEAGWAVVNVAALADGCDGETLAKRVRVEVLRAFALVGGAAFMQQDPIVMRADIMTPKDLDMIKEENFGIDVAYAMSRGLPKRGVTPWFETTYKKACQEGWAPPPTNEFQKAIWDKTHAIPKTPMKIEFDPKKGR